MSQDVPAHSPVRALLEWVPQRGPGKYDFFASLLHGMASADVGAPDGNKYDAVRAVFHPLMSLNNHPSWHLHSGRIRTI